MRPVCSRRRNYGRGQEKQGRLAVAADLPIIHFSGRAWEVVEESTVCYERSRIVDGKVVHFEQRFVETAVRPLSASGGGEG